jgi:hypothetical protein
MALALAGCGGGGSGGGTDAGGVGSGSSAGAGSTSTGTTGGTTPTQPTQPAEPTLAAATAVIDGTTLGTENWQAGSTSSGGTGQVVSGMNCAVAGNTYSYTHLSIYENGQQLALPANIGTVQPTLAAPTGCVYPLNTVDETGKIRMDETSNAMYTLGQFFAVWGQPLSSTNVAGIAGSSVSVYVNNGGALTKYTGDLASLVLPAQGEITIVIGTPLTQIPTYTWTDPPPFNPNPVTLTYLGTVGTTSYWPDGNRPTGGTGADVDGITCAPSMVETYHVHAHLTVIYNGQWLQMPENVGITPSCYYEVHMHDHTGIIHIESPVVRHYTLGEFFDIWGEPLTNTNVAGITGNIVAYINDNGEARRYMGDLRAIELTSHRDITLQIGTPAMTSLPTYTWADEPQ